MQKSAKHNKPPHPAALYRHIKTTRVSNQVSSAFQTAMCFGYTTGTISSKSMNADDLEYVESQIEGNIDNKDALPNLAIFMRAIPAEHPRVSKTARPASLTVSQWLVRRAVERNSHTLLASLFYIMQGRINFAFHHIDSWFVDWVYTDHARRRLLLQALCIEESAIAPLEAAIRERSQAVGRLGMARYLDFLSKIANVKAHRTEWHLCYNVGQGKS